MDPGFPGRAGRCPGELCRAAEFPGRDRTLPAGLSELVRGDHGGLRLDLRAAESERRGDDLQLGLPERLSGPAARRDAWLVAADHGTAGLLPEQYPAGRYHAVPYRRIDQ